MPKQTADIDHLQVEVAGENALTVRLSEAWFGGIARVPEDGIVSIDVDQSNDDQSNDDQSNDDPQSIAMFNDGAEEIGSPDTPRPANERCSLFGLRTNALEFRMDRDSTFFFAVPR